MENFTTNITFTLDAYFKENNDYMSQIFIALNVTNLFNSLNVTNSVNTILIAFGILHNRSENRVYYAV